MQYFVTGTDTGVGKTTISCAILFLFNKLGQSTVGCKPIASGCDMTQKCLVNNDALMLKKHSSIQFPYGYVNPISLAPAIAPHIAAQKINKIYTVKQLINNISLILNSKADLILIEGAGGWQVPLNDKETLADFATELDVPVILVVGIRLGCINHALLTQADIQRKKIKIAGWVANVIDENMEVINENIHTLKKRIDAPCLGVIPFLASSEIENIAKYLNINKLINDVDIGLGN